MSFGIKKVNRLVGYCPCNVAFRDRGHNGTLVNIFSAFSAELCQAVMHTGYWTEAAWMSRMLKGVNWTSDWSN